MIPVSERHYLVPCFQQAVQQCAIYLGNGNSGGICSIGKEREANEEDGEAILSALLARIELLEGKKGWEGLQSIIPPEENNSNKARMVETRGILVCGTGIGISIAANKVEGIRCALCHDHYTATMSRKHNDANVLAIGGRTTGIEIAKEMVDIFLTEDHEGGRHSRRVNKIEK